MKAQKTRTKKIVISGYYGFGSIGDEAVLYSILSYINKHVPDCRVFVLTKDKGSLPVFDSLDIRPVSRINIFSILTSLMRADLFISGGGSLLQDHTSSKSLLYYCSLIHLARLCKCRIMVLANGIGPLKRSLICSFALKCADKISLRDDASLKHARALLGENPIIYKSADPIFAYPFPPERNRFIAALSRLSGKPFFAISIRRCADKRTVPEKELIAFVDHYRNIGYTPLFVSMQKTYDLEICRKLAGLTGGIVADACDCNDLYLILEKAAFAVGMRLHFLLTAAIVRTPFVALEYDPKISGCIGEISDAPCLDAFSFTAKELISSTESALSSFSNEEMHKSCKLMAEVAKADMKNALGLLQQKRRIKGDAVKKKFFADT